MLSRVFLLCAFFLFGDAISAQGLPQDIGSDTIYYRTSFLNRAYLLKGKPINLPVMAFFMSDVPEANNDIHLAQLSDQLTIAGYSLGSLFTIGGLFVSRQDKEFGNNLIQLGLVGIGTGLIFQIVSGDFKFQAVKHYNKALKKSQQKMVSSVQIKAGMHRAGILVGF